MPNLQARTVVNPMTGQATRIMVSSRGLRTLRKWMQEGLMFDLRNFIG
jgi:ribosomal protein L28